MEGIGIKAIIICNGQIRDYRFYKKYMENAGLVICADGGAIHAEKLGVVPNVIIGDFDSISNASCSYLGQRSIEVYEFPPAKDMTDSELAADLAVERNATQVIFIGCIGNRLDHTLANIHLLKRMLDKKIDAVLVDEYNEIRLVKDSIELKREEGYKISLLPLTPVVFGITTRGLYYPLEDATLAMGITRGVSNEFTGSSASISVKEGLLLVIKSRDATR